MIAIPHLAPRASAGTCKHPTFAIHLCATCDCVACSRVDSGGIIGKNTNNLIYSEIGVYDIKINDDIVRFFILKFREMGLFTKFTSQKS